MQLARSVLTAGLPPTTRDLLSNGVQVSDDYMSTNSRLVTGIAESPSTHMGGVGVISIYRQGWFMLPT